MKKKLFVSLAALAASMPMMAQNPAYTIVGKDSMCQIFLYSPGSSKGLHVAYRNDNKQWEDIGQVLSSDYGPWGAEKKMYSPFVARANDGTWRALWSVNKTSPVFAVAYSEDLVVWRPQDYPIVREKGVSDPIAVQMDDGTWDIYLKTDQGKRFVKGDKDFREFKEDAIASTAEDVLWTRDAETVDGNTYNGNVYDVPAVHLQFIYDWMKNQEAQAAADRETSKMNPVANAPISAVLDIDFSSEKKISNRQVGIFFEDISYAADGGLWAEMLQNGDFEYSSDDRKEWDHTTGWTCMGGFKMGTENPLSKNNPNYAILKTLPMYNDGWDGFTFKEDVPYDVSFYARNIDDDSKSFRVSICNSYGKELVGKTVTVNGTNWSKLTATLKLHGLSRIEKNQLKTAKFGIRPLKDSRAAVDLFSLMPQDTYKGHGLRKDLAETIAELKPSFVRFPGGCMSHGDGLDNIYRWKESVGNFQDRKPARNIWGYHQSRRLGFYEYFQWCEDMGAEPLPVLAAGVPCQNSAANEAGVAGQQGGIPMDRMNGYIQDILDLVEWANGDATTSTWARMRAKAGHPEPFNLKMIGIGNEDLISTDFEKRYLMIANAIKKRYPKIEVIGTVGPFHYPSSDYVEGWKVAKEAKFKRGKEFKETNLFSAVDEHYYEQPGWFVNHTDYYDGYDRKAPKVYLGEYAARGKDPLDNALAEAIYLCSLEKNGDVVDMTSYAPLLSKDGHSNWSPDMIYFTNDSVRTTPSYEVQKFFSTHGGNVYMNSKLHIAPEYQKWVATSVVRDDVNHYTWVKIINALPQPLNVTIGNRSVTVPAKNWKAIAL